MFSLLEALDLLTQAITRDWIDQPAVARQAQLDLHRSRQVTPADPSDDEAAELERRILRLIEQRRARTREAERIPGRGLELTIH